MGSSQSQQQEDEKKEKEIVFGPKATPQLYKSFVQFLLDTSENVADAHLRLSVQDRDEISKTTLLESEFLSAESDPRLATIKSVDLSLLSNVRKISASFLNGAQKLEKIDLTPFSKNLEVIGYKTDASRFLQNVQSLRELDFTPFSSSSSRLREINDKCFLLSSNRDKIKLIGLHKLEHVKWPSSSIRSYWLQKEVEIAVKARKKQQSEALRKVALVAFKAKSSSKISLVLSTEYVVFRMTLMMLLPA